MKRNSKIAIVAVLVLSFGCKQEEQKGQAGGPAGSVAKKAPASTATRVEVAVLEGNGESGRIVRPGEIRGAREADLASPLGGLVENIRVSSGDQVRQGAVIAFIDTSIHNAQARLTQVEVDEAERELERLEGLGKAMASARVDTARSRLERAKAQHALSKAQQARAVIRAPFNGVVSGLSIERGEVVPPGATVARLLQLDPVHVIVSVADRDVITLSEGATAFVTTSGSANPMQGEVVAIEPAADLKTRTFLVEVRVANESSLLRPGMIATVSFQQSAEGQALLVPQDFIVTKLDGNGVFTIGDGGKAKWQPVELGRLIGTDVEVTKGLHQGEQLVVLGHRGLADGDELIVTREGICCENGRVVFGTNAAPEKAAAPDATVPAAPTVGARPATSGAAK